MFVCYSTNSPTLYYGAGTINDLCITGDPRLAMEYVRDQLMKAYDSGFAVMVANKPVDYKEFAEYIKTFPLTLVVCRGGRDNSYDYYDIRVEKIPL